MEQKTKSGFSLYVNSNENIQNALFLREKKKKYRMGLIIAFVVVCVQYLHIAIGHITG